MSLVILWSIKTRAIVCVDTAAGHTDGRRYEQSKLLALPHANVVFACRGHLGLLYGTFSRFLHGPASFDSILEQLPEVLRQAQADLVARGRAEGLSDDILLHAHELVTAGWSEKAGRMLVKFFIHNRADGSFVDATLDYAAAPSECLTEADVAKLAAGAGFEDIARKQVDFMRSNWGGSASIIGGEPIAGGRLLVAELTRESTTLRAVRLRG